MHGLGFTAALSLTIGYLFEPEQLKQRILAKNKPYKEYFKQDDDVNVSDEDAILLAESEDGNSDVHE